jgi:hypothetical protein
VESLHDTTLRITISNIGRLNLRDVNVSLRDEREVFRKISVKSLDRGQIIFLLLTIPGVLNFKSLLVVAEGRAPDGQSLSDSLLLRDL